MHLNYPLIYGVLDYQLGEAQNQSNAPLNCACTSTTPRYDKPRRQEKPWSDKAVQGCDQVLSAFPSLPYPLSTPTPPPLFQSTSSLPRLPLPSVTLLKILSSALRTKPRVGITQWTNQHQHRPRNPHPPRRPATSRLLAVYLKRMPSVPVRCLSPIINSTCTGVVPFPSRSLTHTLASTSGIEIDVGDTLANNPPLITDL